MLHYHAFKFLLTFAVIADFAYGQNSSQIQKISGDSDEKKSVITVELNQQASSEETKVEEHGSFIQVLIPNTQVLEPGQFLDGNSPYVRKIAAFQVNESTAGLRLFVAKEAARIQPAVSVNKAGNSLKITIMHADIASPSRKAEAPFDGTPPVDEVIRRTAIRGDIADPALRTHSEPAALQIGERAGSELGNLQHKLEWVTAGAAILFLLVSLSVKYRRKLFKSRSGGDEGPPFTMKTLASFPVAPKQRLTVVEVGGQKLLLGISPDNINYLTEIRETSHQLRSQQILDHISQRPQKTQVQLGQQSPQEPMQSPPIPAEKAIPPTVAKSTSPKLQGDAVRTQLSSQAKSPTPARSGASQIQQKKPPITRQASSKSNEGLDLEEPSSIEDVTNLIRRKLKDLPRI